MTRKELEEMTTEQLDELVHEEKAQEAATVNNGGKEAQISFLLGEEVPWHCRPQN